MTGSPTIGPKNGEVGFIDNLVPFFILFGSGIISHSSRNPRTPNLSEKEEKERSNPFETP